MKVFIDTFIISRAKRMRIDIFVLCISEECSQVKYALIELSLLI